LYSSQNIKFRWEEVRWTEHVMQSVSYELTPWNGVLLDKLMFAQLVKKFSASYRSRRRITVFTKLCHWPLSWSDESSPHHHGPFLL